ncbi:MAG: tRNA (guanosine(46)-N7)-methyltransferase TrmB [Alphaproteobacteria bacterium]|nr:tRNA (guanosine(46)-N7)-methyltransferase TrmB [Alphaproteobacteria bacterium]
MADPARPSDNPNRALRTYGRRRGRPLRPERARLVGELLPRLRVPAPALGAPPGSVDPRKLFDRPVSAVWLELGFGGGEHLAAQAKAHPDIGFIGCEPFENGVAALLRRVDSEGLSNVRILPDDGRPLLATLAAASLDRVFILFPDPWPKTRHQRRRLVSLATLDMLARLLADRGVLRLATDDRAYAEAMAELTASQPALRRIGGGPGASGWRPADAPVSRYEAKARRAGRVPVFFELERQARVDQDKP